MADDLITLNFQPYASLQEELIALRQLVGSFAEKREGIPDFSHHNCLLNAMFQASNYLLTITDFDSSINQALACLGVGTGTEYVSLWQYNHMPEPLFHQRWCWIAADAPVSLETQHVLLQNRFSFLPVE